MAHLRAWASSCVLFVFLPACSSEVDVPTGAGGSAGGAPVGAGPVSGSGATGGTGALSAGSTSTSSGVTATGSTATGAMICPSQSPCGACVSMACPEVWCACGENSECGALFLCFQGCADDACTQACLGSHPDGIADAVLVTGCATDPCGASCPMAMNPISPCEECLYTSCEDEMNACVSNPECTGLWACFGMCAQFDLTCQQACYDTYPDGVAPLEDVFNCGGPACSDPCQE